VRSAWSLAPQFYLAWPVSLFWRLSDGKNVSMVAIFFLFTREITRFVQYILMRDMG
jgi:hypothetical protein